MQFPQIVPPDQQAHGAATRLITPHGLGRLEELGAWLAARQGHCPPRPLARPRLVVFAGDHGIAARGVSAHPPQLTAESARAIAAGTATVNALAAVAGATVRVADLAVDGDTTDAAAAHKVRRSCGLIDVEDALSAEEVQTALAAGRSIADEEVDAGADLLIAGDLGVGNTTPAAVLVAALARAEPVAVVGRGSGIDDGAWMRKTAAIRDALRRSRLDSSDPVALLRTVAGADLAAMAGFLAQAAVRRTPVILDGMVVGAAAMVADELASGSRGWWLAGHRADEPAHELVLNHLQLRPLLDLGMRLGQGTGALAALPLLRLAVATFGDPAGPPLPQELV